MSGQLTAEAFAAMMHGTPAVPLCEAGHRCGRVASHYLESRHHCLIPRGASGKYLYPVCFNVAVNTVANASGYAICPVCGERVRQRDYTELAGKVDERL